MDTTRYFPPPNIESLLHVYVTPLVREKMREHAELKERERQSKAVKP